MKKITMCILLSLFIGLQLCGCGGGGGETLPQKTATLIFSTMSTSTLPTRINGIAFDTVLPVGVSVTTDASNPSQISGTVLSSVNNSGSIVFGTYSASIRKVRINVLDLSQTRQGLALGDFATLTCNIASGTPNLTPESFSPLNNFKAVGIPITGGDSFDLTSMVRPIVKVTFGF